MMFSRSMAATINWAALKTLRRKYFTSIAWVTFTVGLIFFDRRATKKYKQKELQK